MYFTGKLRLFAAVAVMLLASCLPERGAPVLPDRSARAACPEPSLTGPGIPDDAGCDRNLTVFGNIAWQIFKTLVWPATTGRRGEWDTLRPITDMNGPRVFETYKGDWETFQKDALPPSGWHEYPERAAVCANADTMQPLGDDPLVLASLHKFGNIDQRDVPAEEGRPSIRHMVVAQNRTPVRYLTGFSEIAFNSIVSNGLYGPINLRPTVDAPNLKTKAKDGTITIKSAWIDMTGIPDPGSFHTRDALVQIPHNDPTKADCELKRVGLVGLHIGYKTDRSPQWIWASFEHVRNVPLRGTRPRMRYTFHDGTTNHDGTVKKMPDEPPPDARLPTDPPTDPFVVPPPYNVERWKSIPPDIETVNRKWHDLLRTPPNPPNTPKTPSVWLNYELVVVQWPFTVGDETKTGLGRRWIGANGQWLYGALPFPPCRSVDYRSNLANSVLETFLQPDTLCQLELTCMSCHSRARSYDFIWSIPLAHKDPNAVITPSRSRRSALATLHEILGQQGQPGWYDP